MNRRTLLKQAIWMGAAVAFLPSCVYKQDQVSIRLKHLQIRPEDEKLLASLADEIIPATTTPGGKDLGLHLFALKMVDDCFPETDRNTFSEGLHAFAAAKAKNSATTLQQVADEEALKNFAGQYKSLVVHGYTQSEYFMTKVIPYKQIPGGYKGCVPVA